MNFGVSGNVSVSSSRIYSNPTTRALAEIHKDKEDARQREEYRARMVRLNRDALAEIDAVKALKEEQFQSEFLAEISGLWMKNQVECCIAGVEAKGSKKLTARDIINYHADLSGFRYADIIGNRRSPELIKVRHQAIADCYVLCPKMTAAVIGTAFGGRDHTTILYIVKKMGVHYSQTGRMRDHAHPIGLRNLAA